MHKPRVLCLPEDVFPDRQCSLLGCSPNVSTCLVGRGPDVGSGILALSLKVSSEEMNTSTGRVSQQVAFLSRWALSNELLA